MFYFLDHFEKKTKKVKYTSETLINVQCRHATRIHTYVQTNERIRSFEYDSNSNSFERTRILTARKLQLTADCRVIRSDVVESS